MAARSLDLGPHRDGSAGVRARRDVIAEERRRELAEMPLAIGQVFAHRVARAAAGAAALACAFAMMASLAFAPMAIGACLLIASLLVVVSHAVATRVAIAWFANTLRAAVATEHDVHSDLDKLAVGPTEVAQGLVRRLDSWSIGLFLAGVAALFSVFGYVFVIARSSQAMDLSTPFAEGLAARNLGPLAVAMALASALAIVVARGCRRETRPGTPSLLVTLLADVWALIFGILGVFLVLATVGLMMTELESAYCPPFPTPSPGARYALAILAECVVLLLMTPLALWRRRREHARLDD